MPLATFDPAQVLFNFGEVLVTGYADDTLIEVEQLEADFDLMVGAQGDSVRSANNNKSARVKIYLLQSAPCNDLLSALRIVDIRLRTGTRVLKIQNNLGTTKAMGESSFIEKPPTFAVKKKSDVNVWEFLVPKLELFIGGLTVTP